MVRVLVYPTLSFACGAWYKVYPDGLTLNGNRGHAIPSHD
jgi:hypothetical protein